MWTITSIDLSAVPGAQAYMSDGLPVVNTPRNSTGSSYRLMIALLGYADITDLGAQPGGPAPDEIAIDDAAYWYTANATMTMSVSAAGELSVTGDGNSLSVALVPFPVISPDDIALVDEMVELNLIPYQELMTGQRPFTDVAPLAPVLFPWTPYQFQLALSVYDWTTADFFRMDVFNYFRFTAMSGQPLSGPNIVNAIWTTDWPPYQPTNPPFMQSMMMVPANSEADVAAQYVAVNQPLETFLDALKRITTAALVAMPRTSIVSKPMLYSGQVDVSNLSEGTFPVYFQQYPGNAGPPPMNMNMPLEEALTTFMQPGSIVNLKSFMSFTDSLDDAITYSNGIIVVMAPQSEATWTWLQCTYITALSNEVGKTEYLFEPGSQFVMGTSSQQTINGKAYTVINMAEWTL